MKLFCLLFLLAFNKIFLINAMKIFCLIHSDVPTDTLNCPGGNTGIVSNFMSILDSNIDDDITILLTKDPNNQEFFFMLKEYQDVTFAALLYDKTNATGFRNFNVISITIAPFYCNEYKVINNCYNDEEIPILQLHHILILAM